MKRMPLAVAAAAKVHQPRKPKVGFTSLPMKCRRQPASSLRKLRWAE
ncbi:unnamed protein product [Chrysoparadoxa australica]